MATEVEECRALQKKETEGRQRERLPAAGVPALRGRTYVVGVPARAEKSSTAPVCCWRRERVRERGGALVNFYGITELSREHGAFAPFQKARTAT